MKRVQLEVIQLMEVDTMHNIIAKQKISIILINNINFVYLDEFDVIQATVTKLADDLKQMEF